MMHVLKIYIPWTRKNKNSKEYVTNYTFQFFLLQTMFNPHCHIWGFKIQNPYIVWWFWTYLSISESEKFTVGSEPRLRQGILAETWQWRSFAETIDNQKLVSHGMHKAPQTTASTTYHNCFTGVEPSTKTTHYRPLQWFAWPACWSQGPRHSHHYWEGAAAAHARALNGCGPGPISPAQHESTTAAVDSIGVLACRISTCPGSKNG